MIRSKDKERMWKPCPWPRWGVCSEQKVNPGHLLSVMLEEVTRRERVANGDS